jgi:hypothetical protein
MHLAEPETDARDRCRLSLLEVWRESKLPRETPVGCLLSKSLRADAEVAARGYPVREFRRSGYRDCKISDAPKTLAAQSSLLNLALI